MDPGIPTELLLLRQTVRRFVREFLAPHEREVDEQDHFPESLARQLRHRAVALGVFGYNMPETVGGPGLSAFAQTLVNEELGATSVPLSRTLGHLPGSLLFANASQMDWLVRPLMAGDSLITYALTEPDAGSDLGSLRTRAARGEGGWLLNGRKQFISDAGASDHIVVLARTAADAPLKSRFTTFIVSRANPGLVDMSRFKTLGWRGSELNAFALADCFVPDTHVLGEVGEGFRSIMATVNSDRLRVASKCVGLATRAHLLSMTYASERSTFGARLADHQAIQMMIADSDTEIAAARALTHAAASLADGSDPSFRIAASRAKLYASEMAGRVTDRAMQIFGGAGYTQDIVIERLFRDARAYRFGEGTSEMQRIQIARHAIRDIASY